MQNLFYNDWVTCNLLNTVLKVKNRMVVWVIYPSDRKTGLPLPLNPLPWAQVQTTCLFFFPSCPSCLSFLQPWLCRSPFTHFRLVFSENCFTCRRIFDTFMGRSSMSSNILHWFALPLNGFQMRILELLYIKGISIYTFTRSMMNLYCDALTTNEYYPLVCLPISIFKNIHFLFTS